MLLGCKNQYCENDYTTKCNLQIQCDPYQITSDIFHRTRTKNFTVHMEKHTHLFHRLKKIVSGPKSRNLKVQMRVFCRENKAACEIVKNTHSITMYKHGYVRHPRSGRMMSWLHEASEIRWNDVMVT